MPNVGTLMFKDNIAAIKFDDNRLTTENLKKHLSNSEIGSLQSTNLFPQSTIGSASSRAINWLKDEMGID